MIHKTAKTLLLLAFLGLWQVGQAQQAPFDRLAPEPEQAELRQIPAPPAPTDEVSTVEASALAPAKSPEATTEQVPYDEAAIKEAAYRPIPLPPSGETAQGQTSTPLKTKPASTMAGGSDDEKFKAPLRAIPPPPIAKDH